MATTRRLVTVRHGETDWNLARRIQGQMDVPLNETGRLQALALTNTLAGFTPTLIVSSDSQRAVVTAIPFATQHKTPIHLSPGLREIYVGTWEGLHIAEAERQHPEEYARWHSGEDFPRGGGETRAQTARRVADALLEAVRRDDAGDTVFAFSHGVALRVGLDLLAAEGFIALEEPAPHFGNTQWMAVDLLKD